MDNRKWQSGAAGSAPAVEASPSSGYPTDGNPGTATPATVPGARWFHQVGEELRNLISAAGLTPSDSDLTQLQQAVSALINQGGIKTPVRAATTANIASLAGGAPSTLDGVTLAANDRILVKDQTTGSQNGLYVVTTLGTGANGTWTRATDADGVGELVAGILVVAAEGTTNADTIWELSTDGAITIGVTAITFVLKSSGSGYKNLPSITVTVAANALTGTLAAETLDFRSTTLTSGTPVTRMQAAAQSLVVPSGATLGTVSGQSARLVWGWLDNAGTLEPFVANLSGGVNLDETTLINTTAISGASNSANVIYSTTARTGVAFRVRGFCDISEVTAGTWATAPTLVQGAGGQALTALGSLGYGQTIQNVTASRANNTTYTNTTGKPIFVNASLQSSVAANAVVGTINGVSFQASVGPNAGNSAAIAFIVPPGATYSISIPSFSALGYWIETR